MNEQRDSLIKEYKATGDIKLRNKILEDNLELIKKQVGFLCFDTRYKSDFEQEGVIGFLEALERYKEGGNFNTCVFWGIKKRIFDYYRKTKSAIKTTNRYSILLSAVRKHKAAFLEANGREMSHDDLMAVLSQRERHVYELATAEHCTTDQVENIIEYSTNESIKREENEEASLNKDNLKSILEEMPEHESWLIKSRYGIDTTKQNLAQIGFFLKKTPQRIEQMQKAIERKIRKRLNLKNSILS